MAVQSVTANDGSTVSWDDAVVIGEGMMKEVYFSPYKSYVVAFYKERPDAASMDRLKMLVGRYHESIFSDTAGDYWKNFFCWPDKIIEHQGRVGITVPAYQSMF
ncbi:kinase, partial [Oceanospirillum sp. HFRX-1_2]